jgi:hypothetical protein
MLFIPWKSIIEMRLDDRGQRMVCDQWRGIEQRWLDSYID